MTTANLTQDNFDKTVSENDMVVVDFWAPWCAPCRFFSPVFEAAAEKYPDVVFAKVNTDEQTQLAGMFAIRSIPTLMIMRDQVILYQEAGALPASQLEEIIDKAKALDMAAVHREIEDEKRAESALHMRRVCPTARRGGVGEEEGTAQGEEGRARGDGGG